MPENDSRPQGCDGSDISVGVLNYTVCHSNRVEGYAVETYRNLPKAVKRFTSHGMQVPKQVLDCIIDKTYEHDLKIGGGMHDIAKGDWPIPLLCGDQRPTTEDWLNHIYPHPGLSAYHIHHRKGLEKTLHITDRAILMLKCHHMRHDGDNIGYDGENIWFWGEKAKIHSDSEESLFYLPDFGIRWYSNKIMVDDAIFEYLGYGPMDVYQLKGEELEFGAEILKAVDAYDAMTSGRKHRKANKTHEEAIAELISKQEIEFNPLAVVAFSLVQKETIEKIKKEAA